MSREREGRSPLASPAAPWLPLDRPPPCPGRDHRRRGSIDESPRRLSHSELAAAEQLAAEGHQVVSLAETPGAGRRADLLVCGRPVEVKSWLPPAAWPRREPTARSVLNKLLSARYQAASIVLVARGTGLSEQAARAGMAEFASRGRWGLAESVRVLGDGFDLSWRRRLGLERLATGGSQRSASVPRGAERGAGL